MGRLFDKIFLCEFLNLIIKLLLNIFLFFFLSFFCLVEYVLMRLWVLFLCSFLMVILVLLPSRVSLLIFSKHLDF